MLSIVPRRMVRPTALVVTGVVAVALTVARRPAGIWPSQCTPPANPNLLIVTLDTTRADALGAYGNPKAATPSLDRLAREGVLFEAASSVAPLTLPAHASLFTGRLPPRHGARENSARLADSETTLAEVLREDGFHTAAFVGAVVLSERSGVSQGFDTYVDLTAVPDREFRARGRRAPGEAVANAAVAWMGERAGRHAPRFFAWVHLYDAHAPYQPPEPFRSRFPDNLYAGAVAYADAQVGRLLAELERQQLLDRTIVVVMGDHGEGLGEHGELTHGLFLYESVLQVPLIVRAPCTSSGSRVGTVVRTTDVMPTVLELLDVSTTRHGLDGTSLVSLLRGTALREDLEALADNVYPRSRFGWSELRSLRAGRFKLIATVRPELYDLSLDPGEQRNLFHERPRLARALFTRLREIDGDLTSADPGGRPSSDPTHDEVAAGLAALGYVGQSPQAMVEPRGTRFGGAALPDPKDKVERFNQLTTPQGWHP